MLMKKAPLVLFILLLLLPALACANENEVVDEPAALDESVPADDVAAPAEIDGEEAPAMAANAGPDGIYETADCPFDAGPQVECGYLTVPENRAIADSPAIQLAVAILFAPEGGVEAPIVYLEGGPGGSPLATFDPAEWDYPFTRNRDLIFIDQRGTGFSFPSLDCPEMSAEDVDLSQENPERDCRDRLAAEGIDLTAYHTAENAADIAALRAALGIEEWNLLGISYGTRLALEVMRAYPDGIRSVILDSPFPPNADTPVDEVLLTYERMAALFAACAEDPYCAEQYPDLEAVFLETVAALNAEPAGDMTGDVLVTTVSSAMQDTGLIPLIPYAIYEAYYGNLDALDEISVDSYSRRPGFQEEEALADSEGMYNSVMCHDEYIFGDYESVEAAVVGQVPEEVEGGLLQSSFEFYQMCDFWDAGGAGNEQNAAVSSAIPTLILAGEFDTATPPYWAYLAAETLSNNYLFIFPGAGHSLLTTTDCSVDIYTEFLDDPGVEPDRGCIDGIEWPYFE